MKRQPQIVLIAATLALSWLAMQVVHELGHMLALYATDGRVAEVKLHPAAISYTLPAANPRPLIVAWMGPIVGVLLPLVAWSLAWRGHLRGWYVFQFFAGFCLVANGAYLLGGAWYETGDAAEMTRHGATIFDICLFAMPALLAGFWLWNGLGAHFGLGKTSANVDKSVAVVVVLLLSAIIVVELAFAR